MNLSSKLPPFLSSSLPTDQAPNPLVRERLQARARRSAEETARMFTARRQYTPTTREADGVEWQTLYQSRYQYQPLHNPLGNPQNLALRPGEPLQVRLLTLKPRQSYVLTPMPCVFTEWLVLRGDVTLSPTDNPNTNEKGLPLSEFDYHRSLRPLALTATAGQDGALIFLRDSLLEQKIATTPEDLAPLTLRHTGIPWQDHGPNIKRRVLWQQGAMGSMLYLTEAGAFVPQHRHDHDEECFMVRGDVFLDDCLLREGDYQLAPAGTGHHTTSTDTGCIIYAHGDLDMQFLGN